MAFWMSSASVLAPVQRVIARWMGRGARVRRLNHWIAGGTLRGGALLFAAIGCGSADDAVPASVVPVPSAVDADSPPMVAKTTPPPPPAPDPLLALRPPPPEFVDLRTALPDACFAIGYHRSNNFTGNALPGYGAPGAWMLPVPAAALARVQQRAKRDGLKLMIYDAYRPARASKAMVAWARRTGQLRLFAEGYIASKSGHNHGHTVDLGLATPDCVLIDMGTPWDTLTPDSHTRNARGVALENRLRLKTWMQGEGFVPYHREWWHFGFPAAGTRPLDVPYACGEPEEGAWKAPEGWEAADWTVAASAARPCGGG